MTSLLPFLVCVGVLMLPGVRITHAAPVEPAHERAQEVDGYRGIWFDLGQRSDFGPKYSGGLGTYTAKHRPLAVYAPEVDTTFFVFGGTPGPRERHLLIMAGCLDHRSGRVRRPVVVHDKQGVDDPHDNASLQIDSAGHLWVFVSGRGRKRPGFVYRSRLPFDLTSFEQLAVREFTYPQPWWVEGGGFMLLHTKYTGGRELYWSTSDPAGRQWTTDHKLAAMGGHYQVSNAQGNRVITAFNRHPGGKVDQRTDLYFLDTDGLDGTWRTAGGAVVRPPLVDPDGAARVHDYHAENRLVYLKDIGFDHRGNPVILYLTSGHHQPGPAGAPRTWKVAHWTGGTWQRYPVTTSTHNYDMGSLYLEEGTWRIIAPTEPGPQLHGAGGEIAIWASSDEGRTWEKTATVTRDSLLNHGYVRRPLRAHPGFYAFWADGNPDVLSPSRLYFMNRSGDQVWQLPYQMEATWMTPERLGQPAR